MGIVQSRGYCLRLYTDGSYTMHNQDGVGMKQKEDIDIELSLRVEWSENHSSSIS